MTTATTTKRITLATIKAFVKKNAGSLYIKSLGSFDGMTDCVTSCGERQFYKVEKIDMSQQYTLGISGAWFVNGSRNYFNRYEDGQFTGFEVTNCCGCFILATDK